jgi:phenylacetate 2-hydroxylase
LLLDWIGIFGPRRIPGIPYVRGIPIFGVLPYVNHNPALQYSKWALEYGDVFQMRMGSRIVVVANSYKSVKDLWITHSDATNSRPILFTFHTVVSNTQGFTVGTTPYGESYKKKKKVISTALNKKSVEYHSGFISDESRNMFKRIRNQYLLVKDFSRDEDIDVHKIIQGFVLRVSLYLTYGYLVKVGHTDKCRLFDEITHVENAIVKLRGHSSNKQDYVPLLRYLGPLKRLMSDDKTKMANDYRKRRDVYMAKFITEVKEKMARDEDYSDSIVSRALRSNPQFPDVSEAELTSVCLTMVSAGLDNTPLVLNHVLGHLSQEVSGAKFQMVLMNEILKEYGSLESAFNMCPFQGDVQFITALLEEGLRYFSVLPTSLPRTTSKPIWYRNVMIPEGTILFMNAYAANHDDSRFHSPFTFNPMRYLDNDLKLVKNNEGPSNFSFGAGTRICGGIRLAMKEMYITLIRFLVLFEIGPPKDRRFIMKLDPFELNSCPNSVAIEPKAFKIHLKVRDQELFDILVPYEKTSV